MTEDRAKFEHWVRTAKHPEGGYKLDTTPSGVYINSETRCAWHGYRAGLAAAAPDAAMAKDAARYRWLRACNSGSIGIRTYALDPDMEQELTEADADAAIDAAMGGK